MAYESQGALFYISTSTVFDETTAGLVGEITDFSILTGNAAVIDVTHFGSTAKEKIVGFPDEGQVTLGLNFLGTADTGQKKLMSMKAASTRKSGRFYLKLNDTAVTKISGYAFVTGFSVSGAVDNKVSGNVTMEITGLCTISTVTT
jgi:hypothetical protein